MNEMPTEESIHVSKPEATDADEWRTWVLVTEQETPNRQEDAAKFLATMISVSLTLLLAVSGKEALKTHPACGQIRFAVVLWLLSLVSAFFVLFPWRRYGYHSESVQSIKRMHERIVRTKQVVLLLSLGLFLVSLCLLAYAVL